MFKRCLTSFLLLVFVSLSHAAEPAVVSRIAFGSCADQNKPCPIWKTIGEAQPEVLLLLGDNIYADIEEGRLQPSTPAKIVQCYKELDKLADFQKLKRSCSLLATWDDHDYGNNDAGVEWEHKEAAQKAFLDFFGVAADSPRRKQQGIYDATIFGPEGKRVQVIMLDTRYFRSSIKKDESARGIKPYLPNRDPKATMLGEKQWTWLEEQLKKPAEVRILCSSIQVISEEHPFEKWMNIPAERARLYRTINEAKARGVVIISGDRHLGEISLDTDAVGYPLYDVTASGFNQASKIYRRPEKNSKRVAGLPYGNHFGMIIINWQEKDPVISLQLRHEEGEIAVQQRVPLSRLQASPSFLGKKELPRPAGVLSPAEALKKDVGSDVIVQFEVAAGRSVSGGKRILLNSEADYRSEHNFVVVVNASAMTGDLEKVTFEKFRHQTIRAQGKISEFRGSKQIEINEARFLNIIKQ